MEDINMYKEKRGLTTKSAILVVLIVIVTLSFGYQTTGESSAQLPFVSNPFGGRIESVDYCTCSFGFRLDIGPPVPAEKIVVQLGLTQIFMWWQVYRTGPWTLGLWSAGGECRVYAGKSCYDLDVNGQVLIIGTSL